MKIVEQGRVNWKGVYFPICYVHVDTMDTARYLMDKILDSYKGDKTATVERLEDKDIWKVTIKTELAEEEYFFSILDVVPFSLDKVKEGIEMKPARPTCLDITWSLECERKSSVGMISEGL